MRIIIRPVTITLFLIVLFAGACKKESTPPPPINNNHKPQVCYVSTETIKDNYGGSNKTAVVTSFYDANHALTKAVYNEDGSIQTVIFTTNGNQYRSDIYLSQTPGEPGNHIQYVVLYLNANGRADSSTQYNCVDCNIA